MLIKKVQIPIAGKYQELTLTQISPQKLRADFAYNVELKDEIKAWEGAHWHGNDENPKTNGKYWSVDLSERNLYCLKMLLEGKDDRYHSPVNNPITLTRKNYIHQKQSVEEILQRLRCILAGDPGVGKTLIAIQVMELFQPGSQLFWVVVPKSAYYVWKYELQFWQAKLRDDVGVPRSNGFNNLQLIPMHRLIDVVGKMTLPTSIIIDEAHFFKNPSAKRTQILLTVAAHVRKNNGIVLPMSGTCSPRDPSDWWVPAEICQPGFLRESNKTKLIKRLGILENMGDFNRVIGYKKHEVEKLYRRLKGMVIIKRAEDCLDLPPIIYKEQVFEISKEIKATANIIRKSCSRTITALIRLRQFSDGFQPESTCPACSGQCFIDINGQDVACPSCSGTGGTGLLTIDTPKDDALREELTENDRDRIVIYAGFHASIDKIERMCRETEWQVIKVDGRGTKVDELIVDENNRYLTNPQEAFIKGQGKIAYVGHPTAGGVSITLNKSEVIIFYSNDFNGASRMQAEKRIHRIGTTKAIIVDYLWLPTDKLVLDNLKEKKELQNVTLGKITEFWDNYDPEKKDKVII